MFALTARPLQSVDLSPLIPDQLAGKSIAKIKAIELHCGNRSIAVEQLFKVSGNDSENISFLRSSNQLNFIGSEMSYGHIEIRGAVGDFLGKRMKGGRIHVHGNAGNWVGNGMAEGKIEITGDAGDFIGAARPGDQHGMSNGIICVSGNAGDRTGDRMRRGIIIIHGNAGDYCGSRLLAGTIIVLGIAGKLTGYGMKRGTIILGRRPKSIAVTFNTCGQLKMEFLRLLFRQLTHMGRQFKAFNELGPEVERLAGDFACGGKGEILVLQ
ncbi:MAG: formylmethanofuran dehydrogenase subunit C [Gammaproteobacteria bacterium]|nr:formylmethanofuran dehydrogenase subunit C [Gammaproteobacteria bacterium]MCI0590296.1 formylmethanofuran dehydrogenase subunit C [Gammaproteobacteria bacterium]